MPGLSGKFVRRFVRVLRGGFECKISFQFFDGFRGGFRGGFSADFVADFVADFGSDFLSKEIRTKTSENKSEKKLDKKIRLKIRQKSAQNPTPKTRRPKNPPKIRQKIRRRKSAAQKIRQKIRQKKRRRKFAAQKIRQKIRQSSAPFSKLCNVPAPNSPSTISKDIIYVFSAFPTIPKWLSRIGMLSNHFYTIFGRLFGHFRHLGQVGPKSLGGPT
jgi:hypothetical protein